jgi:hypothetical protein
LPARLGVLGLVPHAAAEIDDVVGDPAVERADQPERQLGDRDRVLARAVRDVDPALGRGGDVDRVVAGAGADHEREPAGLEHRARDLGRAHDQHLGLGVADRVDQGLVLGPGAVVEHAATGGERGPAAVLELVGDEHLHAVCSTGRVIRRE